MRNGHRRQSMLQTNHLIYKADQLYLDSAAINPKTPALGEGDRVTNVNQQ